MDSVKSYIIQFIEDYPLYSGIISFVLASLLLIYKLNEKDSISFKNSNMASWNAHISLWVLIIIFYIFSLITLFG